MRKEIDPCNLELFERRVARHGQCSARYTIALQAGNPETIPMFVADTDFVAAPAIREAILEAAEYGIYGYTALPDGYYEAVCGWQERRHNWKPNPDFVLETPTVLCGLSLAVDTLTEPGDAVIITEPVYAPFSMITNRLGRQLIRNQLFLKDRRWKIDFDTFEQQIIDNNVKAFILCNPHNPVGRVWTIDELRQIGAICARHGVYIISDEIHSDIIYSGYQQHSFLSVCSELAHQAVVLHAPSKAFNIPDMKQSHMFILDTELHDRIRAVYEKRCISGASLIGRRACIAAFTQCDDWLDDMNLYLEGNRDFVIDYCRTHLPQVPICHAEGTFILWPDFNALASEVGIAPADVNNWLLKEANIYLSDGADFGVEATGYQRMVIGTQRSVVEEALRRITAAVAGA